MAALVPLIRPRHNSSARNESTVAGGGCLRKTESQAKNIISDLAAINPQSESGLCQLPNEILGLISNALDPLSAVFMSFACKILWRARPRSVLKALAGDAQLLTQYFTMVEADFKSYIPCYICFKLHRRQSLAVGGERPGRSDKRHEICEVQSGKIELCKHYVLYHKDVLLSLRAHKKGPAYGIPLEKLEHKCNLRHKIPVRRFMSQRQKFTSQKVSFSVSTANMGLQLRLKWRSRIDISRREFLSSERSEQVKNQVQGINVVGCRHNSLYIDDVIGCALTHSRDWQNRAAGNEGCQRCNQPLQCRYCATTFTVHVINKRRNPLCTVTVIALKNLGHGRDPTDQPWRGQIRDNRSSCHYTKGVGAMQFLQDWSKQERYVGKYPSCYTFHPRYSSW